MSYEQDLDNILIEMERIYRLAMDAPLSTLNPEQAMEVKTLQFHAKNQKEIRLNLTPELKKGYAEVQQILDSQHHESAQYQAAARLKEQMVAEIEDRRAGLREASQQLEKILGSL